MGTLKVDNIQTESGSAIITNGAIPQSTLRSSNVGMILLNTTTITSSTASATIDSSIITSDYDGYDIFIGGASPVTDSQNFKMKVSYDNGSTFFNTKETGVRARVEMQHRNANTYHYGAESYVFYNDEQIMNHLTFEYGSGNIATAVIKIYGRT